jgi:hypothetical protein
MKVLLSILGVVVGLGAYAFFFWLSFLAILFWNFRFIIPAADPSYAILISKLLGVAGGITSAAMGTFITYWLSRAKWPTVAVGAVALTSLVVFLTLSIF